MIIDKINFIDRLAKYQNDKIIILGHDKVDVDSVVSGYLLEKVLANNGYNVTFCITDKIISKETNDILKEFDFDASKYQREFVDTEDTKYILVDHNERNLKGEIIAIIDHHPTSKKIDLELYFNKAISSTSLYLCKGNEEFNKEDITFAALAAMLDTASFNSTKGREEDKLWVIDKCKQLGIDYNKLYETGLYFAPLNDLKECSLNGLKKYNYDGKKVESSYVHINDDKSNDDKIKQIVEILKQYVKENKLDMFVFIVHDMSVLKTRIYKITNDDVKEERYSKYTSRGNDIMPSIEKNIIKNQK